MIDNKKINRAIILVISCTVFTAIAQIFLKFGANNLKLSFFGLITNMPLIAGLVLYALGAVLLIFALKQGELSLLYPFLSLSYIWVPLLSLIFLGEKLVFLQWIGIFTILIGVSFIRRGVSRA
jgi:uncharacterized membrane protein